ncbi:MAG: alpha/beta hydrolase [Acidimicrobiia bacterium]|nr:MAG: alpha/beta hydrolase [Acidimicrobiia bacterium]
MLYPRTVHDDNVSQMNRASESRPLVSVVARGILLVLVILLVVGHVAGGWYYADEIAEGAFLVDHTEPAPDVEAAGVGEGTITLRPAGADPSDLSRPGLYGFEWEGGYLHVLDPVRVSGDEVVRPFEVVEGSIPPPGALGNLESAAFPDPGAAGLVVEEVEYPTPLGPMDAWITGGDRDTYVIHVHGRGSSLKEALRLMRALDTEGFPQLAITYRNDPGQPADPSGLYQFGRTEWEDLRAAVDYVQSLGARRVVVVGYSMGGAIAVSYLYRQGREPVVAAVLDSPALSLDDAVDFAASRRRVAGLPLPPTLTATAKLIAGLRLGVNWRTIDYPQRAGRLAVPTLVIHGTDDDTIPISTSRRFAEARPEFVTLVEVEGAAHVASWNLDPERYESTVIGFLESTIEG